MKEMEIKWRIERLDEGEERDPRERGCLLKITAKISHEGEAAGTLEAYYVLDDELGSEGAFWELWDMEDWTCHAYEEIATPERDGLRQPLPRLLENSPGLLVVEHIALRPEFRGKQLGREVMRQLVRCCCDENIGAVLVDADPLQRRAGAYDYYDEEVRDLPWDGEEEDQNRLVTHLRSWGMHRLKGTRFMLAPPAALSATHTAKWPPSPVLDFWTTCVCCREWIDRDGGEWEETEEGPVHLKCR